MRRRPGLPRPLGTRLFGSRKDLYETEAVTEHPASTPNLLSDTCLLFDLPAELLNRVYSEVADIVLVLARTRKGSITCNHPLAFTCKQIRQEFLGIVEKERLTRVSVFITQVENFEFGGLMKVLKRNENLNAGNCHLTVKIFHIITSTDINVEKLVAWAKFAASRPQLRNKHLVGVMPPPKTRQPFMRGLLDLARDVDQALPELTQVVDGFTLWWANGKGMYDWVPKGSVPSLIVRRESYCVDKGDVEMTGTDDFGRDDYYENWEQEDVSET